MRRSLCRPRCYGRKSVVRSNRGVYFVLWLMAVLAPCVTGSAQPAETATLTQTGQRILTAPVVIDGQVLFHVRGVTAFPATQRAEAIAQRIAAFAADRSQPVALLHAEEVEHGIEILSGKGPLMLVLDEDAAVEGVDPRLLARVYMDAIAKAVTVYRRDRTRSRLVRNGLLTLGASAAAAAVAFLLAKLLWATSAAVERRYERQVERIEAESFQLVRAKTIWGAAHAIVIAVGVILAFGGAYLYLHFVLNLFPWTRGAADVLLSALLTPLAVVATNALEAIPGLVVAVLIAFAARYLLTLAQGFFDAVGQGRISFPNFDADWASPTLKLVRILIVVFAAVLAYPYIPGSGSAAFKGISIFLGVLFSLGSSSLIANLIAGYTMAYRRAFRVGDRISVGNTIGDVTDVRTMVTHLRSLKNEEVIIPNSTILSSEVMNFSSLARKKGLILHTTVGIGYETSWRQVEAMLLMAADRTGGVLRNPPPYILQKGLGDFSVIYELNVYCDQPLQMDELYTRLRRSILDVFNEYGVQIMTPAYETDPATPKIAPKESWFAAPARPDQGLGRPATDHENPPSPGAPR